MKLFKAIAATACALALASAAQATEYTDSSANYPGGEEGPSWDSGANGGTGFGAWTIDVSNGSEGWAGFGIWNPEANDFQGSWEGKTQAFGLMGKGAGFGVVASRSFRAALDYETGDSFSFDMAVNWDSNAEGSKKGFVLTAKGTPVLTVNHGAYPGHIYINDDDSDEVLNATADDGKPYPISWSFTAKDATTITVKANSRADGTTAYEKDWTVSTSAIDGFILQSVDQYNEDEDRRQSYYDNFKLEIAGELPELCTLEFTAGEWSVASPSQTLSYTLKRSIVSGTLDVDVTSSDSSFVAGKMVTFAGDEAEVSFTLDATLTGSDNYAKLTASADGCDPATYEVRGPVYSCNPWDEGVEDPWNVGIGTERTLWVNNGKTQEQFPADDALITVESSDNGVVEVSTLAEWAVGDDGKSYTSCKITGIASGSATVSVLYGGVKMSDYGFTVPAPIEPGFTLSGPTNAVAGKTYTYTLSVITDHTFEPAMISVTGDASVTPESIDYVYPGTPESLSVTFNTPGDYTLSVATPEGTLAFSLPVTVTEAPDYSKYIAYDDASLYGEGFNPASTGEGTKQFSAWSEYQAEAQNGGVYVGSSTPDSLTAILEGGNVFGLYANGEWENNNYKMYRGFNGDLEAGQEFSLDFACEASGGSRFIQVVRWWEGTGYPRFEVYTSGGYVGVNLEGFEGGDIGWEPAARVVHLSVLRSADSSTYTLSLSSGSDTWTKDIPASTENWGDGLQGFIAGAWNSGSDFFFNRMAIKQVAEPVKARTIGIIGTWNPDATGDYDFFVGPAEAGDPIGLANLTVTPNDGRVTISPASVEIPGDDVAAFTVSVNSIPGEGEEVVRYTITATPEDPSVKPAEFGVEPKAPFLTLSSEKWEHSSDETEIWLSLEASPSFYGTYAITSEDDAVLSVPADSASIDVNEGQTKAWFNVKIEGAGKAHIYATSGEVTRNYGFTIAESIVIPAPTPAKGENAGLAWDASILDNGFVLRGTDTLGESPDKDSWTDLVEGTDYVVEDGTVTVLFSSKYNYIAILKR